VRTQVLHVVLPARDEAAHLPRTLDALKVAVDEVQRSAPGLAVRVTVVLDTCRDGSEQVVALRPWVDVVVVEHGVVGRTRAAGVERARQVARGVPGDQVWVACTDADSQVPRLWLVRQVELAEGGAEYYLGVVHPDAEHLDPLTRVRWWERHHLVEGHTHVHGANLGFTLAAYDAVGGFAPVSSGEDVLLAAALCETERQGVATARNPVLTSGRTAGRAPLGFAAYLRDLESPDGAPA
jgi:hypothetical protein